LASHNAWNLAGSRRRQRWQSEEGAAAEGGGGGGGHSYQLGQHSVTNVQQTSATISSAAFAATLVAVALKFSPFVHASMNPH